jgi:hypothetical protein
MIIDASKLNVVLVLSVLLTLIGCRKPYDYGLSNFNESAKQSEAVILVSSPQVYARETLADDRRREAEFLEQLLKESKDATFQPQIRRELASISLLTSQLGLSFDPKIAVDSRRSKEIGSLEEDVRETQLRLQLHQLQQQINAVTAGSSVQNTSAPNATVPVPDSAPKPVPPSEERIKSQVQDLRSHIDKVLEQLKGMSGDIKNTSITSSPQEAFRDKQAYRNELRAALGAVNLDDLHDADGNALFQLQFRATVLPGEHKDQYGAARLSINPPKLFIEDVNDLYRQLLSIATYQINLAQEQDTHINYAEIGIASGLFDIAEIYIHRDRERIKECYSAKRFDCVKISLAVPRELSSAAKEGLRVYSEGKGTDLYSLAEDIKQALENERGFDAQLFGDFRTLCDISGRNLSDLLSKDNFFDAQTKQIIAHWLFVEPVLRDAVQGISKSRLNNWNSRMAKVLEEISRDRRIDEATIIDTLQRHHPKCSLLTNASINRSTVLFPDEFGTALIQNYGAVKRYRHELATGSDKYRKWVEQHTELGRAKGNVYVYSAGPIEQAQRVSSLTSAVEALQMTMALSAILPVNGVGLNQSMGTLQHALGKAEALEREPIVVGFSGRHLNQTNEETRSGYRRTGYRRLEELSHEDRELQAIQADSRPYIPNFGWIFGPRVVVDPRHQQLRLEQTVATHMVTTDISAPAWWPSIEFDVQSAWIHNWHDRGEGTDLFEQEKSIRSQTLLAALPKRSADLETLMFQIARAEAKRNFQETQISSVIPQTISYCNKQVTTFLVEGPDVWRTTKAFLAGISHKDIQILPDMKGVAVQFDLANLPRFAEKAMLSVATRRGTADYEIKFVGSTDGKTCGDAFNFEKRTLEITSVSPVTFCEAESTVLITLRGPFRPEFVSTNPKVFLGSLEGKVSELLIGSGSEFSVLVTFEKNRIPPSLDGTATLTVISYLGTFSSPVRLLPGNCGTVIKPLSITSAHTVPLERVNVCSPSTSVYVVGTKLDVVTQALLKVQFKDGEVVYPASSLMVSNPEGVLEVKFSFAKPQGQKEVTDQGQLILRGGTGSDSIESTKQIGVICQTENAR